MTPIDLLACIALACVAGMAVLIGINALDDLADRRQRRGRLPTILARLDAHARAIRRLESHQTPGEAPRSDREAVVIPLHRPRPLRAVPALSREVAHRGPAALPRGRRPPSIIRNDAPA